MSSASWDLVQQLAQEFFNVQQQNCSLRLSERNWVEIVDRVLKVHNMTVVYTKDGKEMVTPEQLLHEIKIFLDMHEGRASFSEMQDGLGVDYAVIEDRCMELVRRCGTSDLTSGRPGDESLPSWRCWRILDQLVTNDYCDRLTAEIASELETTGRVGVGTLATRYQLPAEFVRKLLPTGTSSKNIIDGDFVYSSNFIKRATCRLVGFLSASVRPQRFAAFAQQTGLPERLLTSVMDDAISSGRLAGTVQQRTFVPNVFTDAQRECIRSALSDVYVDASVLRRLGAVGDVTEVIRREWAPSNDEPVAVGTSGFIRKSAYDRLGAAVEDACKEVSGQEVKEDSKEGAGWLDTNGAAAALGGSTGSIPQDVVEQLLRGRGGIMEIIDCNLDEKQAAVKGKGDDSFSSEDNNENKSSGEEPDKNVENEEECSLVAVAPWLVAKCADSLYHLLAAKINERKQQALMSTPAVPAVLMPQQQGGDASATGAASEQASEAMSTPVSEALNTPSGTQSKRRQGRLQPGEQKRKGGATPALSAAPTIPKMYRVSRRRLVRLLRKNRATILTPDFPESAIKPFVYQHVHAVVSKRLIELSAMTPKSNAAATATSAKLMQQQAGPGSSANFQTELPKLIVTLASCWRGVSQQFLTGTGATVDRDRRAIAVHLRELLSSQIVEILRSLALTSKEPGSGSAELLTESINSFESNFASGDVDTAIESLRSLFGLPFARSVLNSVGLSANGLSSILATATGSSPGGAGSANRNKGGQQKSSAASMAAIGVSVEQLRNERLAAGILKLQAMVADEASANDPLLLPNVLLLVASLTFERLTGDLMSCPGRLVPSLVNFLVTNKGLEPESARILTRALTTSQKQLRSGSSPAPSADQKELVKELIAIVDKS